jgi:ubiquinone biosynthesis protein
MAFVRNGFGFIVKELGLFDMLSFPRRWFIEGDLDDEVHTKTTGERVRLFLEELGPAFVKMGQIASTRPDIVPAGIIKEREKLQDHVPPFSFEQVQQIMEEELGATGDTIFREFQAKPLAAASIGQVHYAVLHSGEPVAVKVQRPDIRNTIETDLEILQDLAQLAEKRLEWASRYQLGDIVEELAKSLRTELDYTIEGRNAEKIAKQFELTKNIRIPHVYWEYSTKRILTMEYIQGSKLNEQVELENKGFNCKILAERLVRSVLHQILIEGFFHGDLHPGNVWALPGEVIVFIDFGMVGRLTPEIKYHFASLVIAMMRQSTDGVIKAITRMGIVPDDVHLDRLRSDVDQLREKYLNVPLSQVSLGESVNDLFAVALQHHIRMPADLTILGKTLLTLEGIVQKLDPELSILKIAEPFGRQLLKERFHPKKMAGSAWNNIVNHAEVLTNLPKHIHDITSILKKGKMRMEVTIPELDRFLTKLDRISNRLSFSIVLLSFSIVMVGLIIGSALGRQTSILWNLPAIEIGFGVATLMFLWLLFSIFKSGRF